MEKNYTFSDFVEIIDKLRGENGCPWDKEQTFLSLRRYLIEEAYEYIEATNLKDSKKQADELGDILLQVVLNARIGKEENKFDINDVINNISRKMVYRHPHVFSDVKVKDAKEVSDNWEELKKKEQNIKSNKDVLLGITNELPALLRAQKVVGKIKKWEKNENLTHFDKETIDKLNKLLDNNEEQVDNSYKKRIINLFISLIYIACEHDLFLELALNEEIDNLISNFK